VAHADNLTIFDMKDFANKHAARPTGTEMTMMVFGATDPRSCGIVELDERGVVKAFHEKVSSPPCNLANAAVYILEPSVIDLMATLGKEQIDFSTEVIPRLMGCVFTYHNSSYHRDIGTIQSWVDAHREFRPAPATTPNAEAWLIVSKSLDGRLAALQSELLSDL
jgi:mannose-1-phosphate guanylyltransferase